VVTFALVKFVFTVSIATTVAAPVLVSLVFFVGIGWLSPKKKVSPKVDQLLSSLSGDEDLLQITQDIDAV
jgi:SSS family solute:Na+ symporter